MKPIFNKKVLKNGMTILFEKRNLPIVSVAFAARAGGINEKMEEKGISHFIEHMLFKGTKKRPSNNAVAGEIEKKGGEINGGTDDEVTFYHCKIPSEHLNVALDVFSDIVKNPLLDEKELEKERKVIFEEIKMNHDNPLLHVFKEIQKALYEEPFGYPRIGNYKTMNSIDRKKLFDKFKKFYSPDNLILCVVGDANFEEIVSFAEKTFGTGKKEVPKLEIKTKNEEKIEKRKGIDQAHVVFAYHVPFGEDKKKYSAMILSTLMAGGLSSRLFEEIREKRNLAYAIKGDYDIGRYFGNNFIYIGTMPENVEIVKKLILEEFEKVSRDLGEKELNDIKEQMIGNYHIAMEDSQSQMINLIYSEVHGNAENFYDFDKRISEVKLEDVKNLAKNVAKNYSFFALVPED